MKTSLRDEWLRRAAAQPFRAVATLTDAGLILGAGTILVPFAKRLTPGGSDTNDRLVALLAVADRGRVFKSSALQIEQALSEWGRGEKALATLRLAFLRLPRLQDTADAHRLFLAEKALDAGVTPSELLSHLGYATALSALRKYPGQPRQPAGVSTGGQFAGGPSGTASSQPTGASAGRQSAGGQERPAASTIPVFLDTRRQQELETKQLPPGLAHEPYDIAIPKGHALDLDMPGGAPLPMPSPRGTPHVETGVDQDEREGPACPVEAPDRGHGATPAANAWEHSVHRMVNPSDPTKDGNAYYLPNPLYKPGSALSRFVSYDDCKRTDEL